MLPLRDWPISSKLAAIVGLAVLGFAAFGMLSYSIINTVRIDGAVYKAISLDKTLQSDAEPPSLYPRRGQDGCLIAVGRNQLFRDGRASQCIQRTKKGI